MLHDVSTADRTFRETILAAERHHIPASRQSFFFPALNEKTRKLAQQRDQTGLFNPSDPFLNVSNKKIMAKTAKDKEKRNF